MRLLFLFAMLFPAFNHDQVQASWQMDVIKGAKALDWSNKPINVSELEELASILKAYDLQLEEINLTRTGLTSKGLEHLAFGLHGNKTVTKLVLTGAILEEEGLSYLAIILQSSRVERLNLGWVTFPPNPSDGFGAFIKAIEQATSLKELILSYQNFNSTIFKAIEQNKSILTLDLSRHLFWFEEKEKEDAAAKLLFSLIKNKPIKELRLEKLVFKANTVKEIFQNLKKSNVQFLYFGRNEIGKVAGGALVDFLKNKNLILLDLKKTSIGSNKEIFTSFTNILKTNKTLQQLDLEDTKLTDEDAIALSNSLKSNRSLHSLNLSENPITVHGIVRIAAAIRQNTCLKQVSFSKPVSIANQDQAAYNTAIKDIKNFIRRNKVCLVLLFPSSKLEYPRTHTQSFFRTLPKDLVRLAIASLFELEDLKS